MEKNSTIISKEILIEFGKLIKDLLNDIQISFHEIFESIIVINDYKVIYESNITILENENLNDEELILFNSIKNIHAYSLSKFPAKFFDKEQMPAAVQSSFNGNDDDEENDMEEMFVDGPAGVEWGGPTRGGARPEPTRFGDWERKGRASDF